MMDIKIEVDTPDYQEMSLSAHVDDVRFRKFAGEVEWKCTDFLTVSQANGLEDMFVRLQKAVTTWKAETNHG